MKSNKFSLEWNSVKFQVLSLVCIIALLIRTDLMCSPILYWGMPGNYFTVYPGLNYYKRNKDFRYLYKGIATDI